MTVLDVLLVCARQAVVFIGAFVTIMSAWLALETDRFVRPQPTDRIPANRKVTGWTFLHAITLVEEHAICTNTACFVFANDTICLTMFACATTRGVTLAPELAWALLQTICIFKVHVTVALCAHSFASAPVAI